MCDFQFWTHQSKINIKIKMEKPTPVHIRETRKFEHKDYVPKFPEIYTFSPDFLEPEFVECIEECKKLDRHFKAFAIKRIQIMQSIFKSEYPGTYSCKIFTDEFCYKLMMEYDNFEQQGFTKIRPNSMNSYGCIMDELGLGDFFDVFVFEYIRPFAKVMSKDGDEIDDHHSFLVAYAMDKDVQLDFHTDDSDLTLNTCLGKKFEGGGLYFAGHLERPETWEDVYVYDHQVGYSVIHDGMLRHGALNIESGERYNLIIWCRSSRYRNSHPEEIQQEIQNSAPGNTVHDQ
jgi:hypothetical protein